MNDLVCLEQGGVLALVQLPADEADLHPDEARHAAGLAARRRVTWAGGRVALRRALAPRICGPIFATPRGAPLLPAGLLGSVSHKDTVAAAWVCAASGATCVGVDIEIVEQPKMHLAPRILTPDELQFVQRLADPWPEVLLRFALKEAFYKAVDPFVQRYVGFDEVALNVAHDGTAVAQHQLGLVVELHWRRLAFAGQDLILAMTKCHGP